MPTLRPRPDTPFAAASARLDDAIGAHVSDFRLACALGVATSTVDDLTRGRRPCRRVYLVAMEHVGRIGVEAADEMDDATPAAFARLMRSTVLTPSQIARALGLDLRNVQRMARDVKAGRRAVQRVYVLALLEL